VSGISGARKSVFWAFVCFGGQVHEPIGVSEFCSLMVGIEKAEDPFKSALNVLHDFDFVLFMYRRMREMTPSTALLS
jgi:hypothetical protein